jgi:tetratricopeptide (TPR) repeat protein
MSRFVVALTCCLVVTPAARAQNADGDAQIHVDRGHAKADKQEWDAAIREYEAAYRIKPQPQLLHDIADSAEHAGQRQKAIDHYHLYLQLRPDAPDRDAVEKHVAELEKLPPEALVAPAPPKRDRKGLIIGLSVAGGIIVVGAVAAAVVLASPSSSDFHNWGTLSVTLH